MRLFLMIIVAAVTTQFTAAQTQIDFQTQTKSATRPVKAGTVLPAACTAGDMFLKTNAPGGAGLYGCVAANTWVVQGGGGNLRVESNGALVGTSPVQNFQPGAGIITALTDTGSRIDITQLVDTGYIQTRGGEQSGVTLLCASAGQSATNYTCAMNPALTAYTDGMVLHWKPDMTVSGGAATLSIDALGPRPVKTLEGYPPAAADIVAGQLYPLWYDGSAFRLATSSRTASAAVRPVCDAPQRGRLWQTFADSGTKDELAICAKDSVDGYAWRTLY